MNVFAFATRCVLAAMVGAVIGFVVLSATVALLMIFSAVAP